MDPWTNGQGYRMAQISGRSLTHAGSCDHARSPRAARGVTPAYRPKPGPDNRVPARRPRAVEVRAARVPPSRAGRPVVLRARPGRGVDPQTEGAARPGCGPGAVDARRSRRVDHLRRPG